MHHSQGATTMLPWLLILVTIGHSTDAADTVTVHNLVTGNNEFAFDVFKHLKPNQNVVYAPLGISTVFGMLYLGAESKTKEQLKQTLYFNRLSDEEVHQSFKTLNSTITNTSSLLFSANRLYAQPSEADTTMYTSTLERYYNTQLITSNFISDSDQVRKEINQWVSTQTRGKIVDLISEGSLDSRTSMVLVNAIYFKGEWLRGFDVAHTAVDMFHINTEKSVLTSLMFQSGQFNYGYSKDLKCQFLELPYKDERMSMIVVLPDDVDGIERVENDLVPAYLDDTKMYKTKVDVYLPKFKIDHSFDVKDAAKDLGIIDLFDAGTCDLSGIDSTRQLYVSQMFHKAFIEVSEEGTEAAAATHATITKRSIPEPPEMFVADHPFIFLIRDRQTKSVLFLGRLIEPEIVGVKDEL